MKVTDLTYRQLYDSTLAKIKSMCYNVDSNRLPDELKKPDYSKLMAQKGDAKVTFTIQNPVLTVTSATIQSQLQSFLTSRGAWVKLDQIVTPRGLLNYFSNIAVFCRSHISVVSSQLITTGYPVYVSTASQPSVSSLSLNEEIVNNIEINDMLNLLNNLLQTNCGTLTVRYNTVTTCSCSSTSSSCSSSSSCCSSSSYFIAFMLI